MNKIEYLTTLDFFRSISRDGCDGGADIGNDVFCIEECQDVRTVFNGGMSVFLVVIERIFYLEAGVGYFGCDCHTLWSGSPTKYNFANTIACLFHINKLSRSASRGNARAFIGVDFLEKEATLLP